MHILIRDILKYKKFIIEIVVRIESRIIEILLIQFSNNLIQDFEISDIKVIYNVDNYIHKTKGFLSYESIII